MQKGMFEFVLENDEICKFIHETLLIQSCGFSSMLTVCLLSGFSTFLKRFTDEISAATDNENKDHSYEYVATQLVAEYIRLLGYDGIGFNSSTGTGDRKSVV